MIIGFFNMFYRGLGALSRFIYAHVRAHSGFAYISSSIIYAVWIDFELSHHVEALKIMNKLGSIGGASPLR